jgi:hypothetical protein
MMTRHLGIVGHPLLTHGQQLRLGTIGYTVLVQR